MKSVRYFPWAVCDYISGNKNYRFKIVNSTRIQSENTGLQINIVSCNTLILSNSNPLQATMRNLRVFEFNFFSASKLLCKATPMFARASVSPDCILLPWCWHSYRKDIRRKWNVKSRAKLMLVTESAEATTPHITCLCATSSVSSFASQTSVTSR